MADGSEAGLTLKVDFAGDVRRCKWRLDEARSAEAIAAQVCRLYAVAEGSLMLQYRAEDGEVRSFGEATLDEALECGRASGGVLRIVATGSAAVSSAASDGWEPVEAPVGSMTSVGSEPAESVGDAAASDECDAASSSAAEEAVAGTAERVVVDWDGAVGAGDVEAPASAEEEAQDAAAAAASDSESRRRASGARRARGSVCDGTSWIQPLATRSFENVQASVERAKPRLSACAGGFQRSVVEDFRSSREDMKRAFLADMNEDEAPALRKVGNVVGAVAGSVVALRMAPVRVTRLAAESVAAFRSGGGEAVSTDEAELRAADGDEGPAAPAAVPAPAPAPAPAPVHEVQHFVDQVKSDFAIASGEVSDVLGYVVGGGTTVGRDGAGQGVREGEDPYLATTAVSTVVGVFVAACLVPVRAVRLGVAASGRGVRAGIAAASGPGADQASAATAAPATEAAAADSEQALECDPPLFGGGAVARSRAPSSQSGAE